MAEKAQRGRTIPVASWWRLAVRDEIDKRKVSDPDFSQLVLAKNTEIDPGALSHYLKGTKMPVYEHAIAISDALELPYPVIIPTSYKEAEHLAGQRRLWRSDVTVREIQIQSGLATPNEQDQSGAVSSQNGRPQPRRKATRGRHESPKSGHRGP